MTTYTIQDGSEITSGLSAVDAASILLTDDGCEWEIRAGEECTGILESQRYYELWTRQQVASQGWTKTVIDVIAATEEEAEVEIALAVIRSGHWERGELQCRTDEQHAAMMAEVAAETPARDYDETWYEFTSHGRAAHYGLGFESDARRYCEVLNRASRLLQPYSWRAMEDDEVVSLDDGTDTDGFRLDDALAAADEQAEG